jgi:hypothetical protein
MDGTCGHAYQCGILGLWRVRHGCQYRQQVRTVQIRVLGINVDGADV